MKIPESKDIGGDLSRSDFAAAPAHATHIQKWLLPALICFFIALSLGTDLLWSSRKCYFAANTYWKCFTTITPITYDMRYSPGHGGEEIMSLSYLSSVRLFYSIIPDRLLSLRVLSVVVSSITLFFLYRFAAIMFCRPVGFIFIFLLITTPISVESLRAFGYMPLTRLFISIICYLVAVSLNNKKIIGKTALLAFFCLPLFSLYLMGRMIVVAVILFFGIYFWKHWKKLTLFLLFLAGFIVIMDSIPGEGDFSAIRFFGDFSGSAIRPDLSYNMAALLDCMERNFVIAWEYLVGINRESFSDRNMNSRLFNSVYTPFLLLGFGICLWKRRPSNIFLLLLWILLFIVPVASVYMEPRRIILGLDSIYLMIALGLWSSFVLLWRIFSRRRYRITLTCISLAILALVGARDIYELVYIVAKPEYDLSEERLKKVAEFVTDKVDEVDWITYHKRLESVVLGNPYLIPQPAEDDPYNFCAGEGYHNNRLKRYLLDGFLKRHSSLLLLSHARHPAYGSADIEWLEMNLPDLVKESAVPGTEIRYLLLEKQKDIPPNLLIPEDITFTSPAGLTIRHWDPDANTWNIVDDSPDDKTLPPDFRGVPGWLIIDFGEGNDEIVRVLAARPTADQPELFFRRAALLGSPDRKTWDPVASIVREDLPESDEWLKWVFENDRAYRFYAFIVYDGYSGSKDRVLMTDLVLFENDDRQIWMDITD